MLRAFWLWSKKWEENAAKFISGKVEQKTGLG